MIVFTKFQHTFTTFSMSTSPLFSSLFLPLAQLSKIFTSIALRIANLQTKSSKCSKKQKYGFLVDFSLNL